MGIFDVLNMVKQFNNINIDKAKKVMLIHLQMLKVTNQSISSYCFRAQAGIVLNIFLNFEQK